MTDFYGASPLDEAMEEEQWTAMHVRCHDPAINWLYTNVKNDGIDPRPLVSGEVSMGLGCIALDLFLQAAEADELTDDNREQYTMFLNLLSVGAAFQRAVDRREVQFNGKPKLHG